MKKTIKRILALSSIVILIIYFNGCASKKYRKGTPATMKDYHVRGKHYYPTYVKLGQKMRGISSWYGPNFHGKRTCNCERYNMYAHTAAHKTWPMNTMVRVTNLQNGKSTIVRINDRGPFVRGRIIDCSYKAGKEIGLDKMGIAKVQIEVVGFKGKVYSRADIRKIPKAQQQIKLSNFGVQVGAFKRLAGAEIYKLRHARLDKDHHPIIKKMKDDDGTALYRVWLMGFETEDEALDFIELHGLNGAFVVRE